MRTRAAAFAAALLLALAWAAPALALDAPVMRVARVRYEKPTVEFGVTPPSGATTVSVIVDGVAVASRGVSGTGEVVIPVRVALGTHTVRASASCPGTDTSLSARQPLDTSEFKPQWHSAAVWAGDILGPNPVISGKADMRTAGVIVYSAEDGVLWKGPITRDAYRNFKLPAFSLPYGRQRLYVVAYNAWGSRWSPGVNVYNLGPKWTLPSLTSYVMVDKDDCGLYHISWNRVLREYPVAVGMFGTPTPEGYFVLGRTQWLWGNSDWGVLRMPIYRKASNGTVARSTYYYIHGTNDPDSIGTWASHGCIRMYNEDAVRVSRTVSPGATVFIRR